MTRDRKNIKVKPDAWETLADHKPDSMTWSEFLVAAAHTWDGARDV